MGEEEDRIWNRILDRIKVRHCDRPDPFMIDFYETHARLCTIDRNLRLCFEYDFILYVYAELVSRVRQRLAPRRRRMSPIPPSILFTINTVIHFSSDSDFDSDSDLSDWDNASYVAQSVSFSCEENSSKCPICLETITHEEKVRKLPCTHVFHTDCIDHWFTSRHTTCPLCRCDYG